MNRDGERKEKGAGFRGRPCHQPDGEDVHGEDVHGEDVHREDVHGEDVDGEDVDVGRSARQRPSRAPSRNARDLTYAFESR